MRRPRVRWSISGLTQEHPAPPWTACFAVPRGRVMTARGGKSFRFEQIRPPLLIITNLLSCLLSSDLAVFCFCIGIWTCIWEGARSRFLAGWTWCLMDTLLILHAALGSEDVLRHRSAMDVQSFVGWVGRKNGKLRKISVVGHELRKLEKKNFEVVDQLLGFHATARANLQHGWANCTYCGSRQESFWYSFY